MAFEIIPYQLQEIRKKIAKKMKLPDGIEERLQVQIDHLEKIDERIKKLEDWCQRRRRIMELSRKQIRLIREHLSMRCHECGSQELAYRGTDVVCETCGTVWGKETV